MFAVVKRQATFIPAISFVQLQEDQIAFPLTVEAILCSFIAKENVALTELIPVSLPHYGSSTVPRLARSADPYQQKLSNS